LDEKKRYELYERIFSVFADQIVAVSKPLLDHYTQLKLPESKLNYIKNGIPFSCDPLLKRSEHISRRKQVLAQDKKLYQELKIHQNDIWLLYLARIHPVKGQMEALELWNALAPEFRESSVLLFVGPCAKKGFIEKLGSAAEHCSDNERIFFCGPARTDSNWYKISDLFISCSTFEGMPLAPLEALGAGLPLFLSDIPGHRFLKKQAVLFPPSDLDSATIKLSKLKEQILKEDSNLLQQLDTDTLEIRQSYSISEMALAYYHLYRG